MFLPKIEGVILNEVKDLRLRFYARNLWDTTLAALSEFAVLVFRRPVISFALVFANSAISANLINSAVRVLNAS